MKTMVALSDGQIDAILAALILANTRYHTDHNGDIFMDFTFKDKQSQNEYAQHFIDVDTDIRKQLQLHKFTKDGQPNTTLSETFKEIGAILNPHLTEDKFCKVCGKLWISCDHEIENQ
jgi:hypothetical protein